jgi:hypothetical protein
MKSKKLDTMHGHKGDCAKCGMALVKMARNDAGELLPESCFCLNCGARYYMEIPDLGAWEKLQWKQKQESFE